MRALQHARVCTEARKSVAITLGTLSRTGQLPCACSLAARDESRVYNFVLLSISGESGAYKISRRLLDSLQNENRYGLRDH